VFAGGQAVAIYKSRSDSTEDTLYLQRDHVGSVTQLTRVTGGTPTVVESLSNDPWGKRRNLSLGVVSIEHALRWNRSGDICGGW
jgi:hypothetical protein